MVLDLRSMRWAIVASQHRSLRQASEVLNIRQSTLSRALRELELQLGATLFERTNGGTHPTVAGQDFLESAQRIVEETEAITVRLKNRARGESGRLAIGVHSSLSAGNLRATLIEHRQRFPDVETRLIDGSSDHLISDLASSTIDVAFAVAGNPRCTGRSLPLWSERVVAALADNHPLNRRDLIHWSDLRQECLLLPLRGAGPEFHQLLMSKMGGVDLCRVTFHDVALDRFLTLVGAGCGILLELEGATGVSYQGVSFREVHDNDGPTRLTFNAVWRQDNVNPSLRPFLDMLRERYPDLSTEPPAA